MVFLWKRKDFDSGLYSNSQLSKAVEWKTWHSGPQYFNFAYTSSGQ